AQVSASATHPGLPPPSAASTISASASGCGGSVSCPASHRTVCLPVPHGAVASAGGRESNQVKISVRVHDVQGLSPRRPALPVHREVCRYLAGGSADLHGGRAPGGIKRPVEGPPGT